MPNADVHDPRRIRPDGAPVRPDGFIPPQPAPIQAPVDNKGAPKEVLADHEESMDDNMDEMGVSLLGGFVRPYSMEGQPVRRPGQLRSGGQKAALDAVDWPFPGTPGFAEYAANAPSIPPPNAPKGVAMANPGGPVKPRAAQAPQKAEGAQKVQATQKPAGAQKAQPVQNADRSVASPRPPRHIDNSGAPLNMSWDTESQDDRALALGSDVAGGFAVPYQLDGTTPGKKRK